MEENISNKRTKISENGNNFLFNLLNTVPIDNETVMDENKRTAILKEIQRNPSSASIRYRFKASRNHDTRYDAYPLHQAIRLRATVDVIEAIFNAYPPAAKETCNFMAGSALLENSGKRALHVACIVNAPTDVISFILKKCPKDIRVADGSSSLPLHCACAGAARVDVLSLLLKTWPGAAREKTHSGKVALHIILRSRNLSLEKVSLLLHHYPDALTEKDAFGRTPLHYACSKPGMALDLILMLLVRCPTAVKERDNRRDTPLHDAIHIGGIDSENIKKVLFYVSRLCDNEINDESWKEMISFFFENKWWYGITLILDQYPTLTKSFKLDTTIFPQFLSFVGRRCKMKTLWYVLSNELDLMIGS